MLYSKELSEARVFAATPEGPSCRPSAAKLKCDRHWHLSLQPIAVVGAFVILTYAS